MPVCLGETLCNSQFWSLEGLGSGQSFGVCSDVKEGEIINYMAAYDVTDKTKAEELGLSIKDIPAAEYAIIVQSRCDTSQHPPCLEICLGSLFSQKRAIRLRSAGLWSLYRRWHVVIRLSNGTLDTGNQGLDNFLTFYKMQIELCRGLPFTEFFFFEIRI